MDAKFHERTRLLLSDFSEASRARRDRADPAGLAARGPSAAATNLARGLRPQSASAAGSRARNAANLGHGLGLAAFAQHAAGAGPAQGASAGHPVHVRAGGNGPEGLRERNFIWTGSQGKLHPSGPTARREPVKRPKSAAAGRSAPAQAAAQKSTVQGPHEAPPGAPSWSAGRYFAMPTDRGARPRQIVKPAARLAGPTATPAGQVHGAVPASERGDVMKRVTAGTNSPDGVSFTDETEAGIPIVHRTKAARQKNPERMNLDRRGLEVVPIIENEPRLRLLNLQHNKLAQMSNLRLANLVFLDLFDNRITEIGPLEGVPMLRVLMMGKNRVSRLNGALSAARHLDVLDLHANELVSLEEIGSLASLRVLNVASNKLTEIRAHDVRGLRSLTELNARRNKIESVSGVRALPSLQHVFLSNNELPDYEAVEPVLKCRGLTELTLDGNDAVTRALGESIQDYRREVARQLPNLHVLDLLPVQSSERHPKLSAAPSRTSSSSAAPGRRAGPGAKRKASAETKPVAGQTGKGNSGMRAQQQSDVRITKESAMNVRFASDFLYKESVGPAGEAETNDDPLRRWTATRPKIADPDFISALQLDLLEQQIRDAELRKGYYEVDTSGPCALVRIYGRAFAPLQNAEVMRDATAVELQQCALDDLVTRALPDLLPQVTRVTLTSPLVDSLRDLAAIASALPPTVASLSIKASPIVCLQFYRPWLIYHLPTIGVLDGVIVTPGEREAATRLLGPLVKRLPTINAASVTLEPARAKGSATRIAAKAAANLLQRVQRRVAEELEFQDAFETVYAYSVSEADREAAVPAGSDYWDRALQSLRAEVVAAAPAAGAAP